jgi:hypothetical protein
LEQGDGDSEQNAAERCGTGQEQSQNRCEGCGLETGRDQR